MRASCGSLTRAAQRRRLNAVCVCCGGSSMVTKLLFLEHYGSKMDHVNCAACMSAGISMQHMPQVFFVFSIASLKGKFPDRQGTLRRDATMCSETRAPQIRGSLSRIAACSQAGGGIADTGSSCGKAAEDCRSPKAPPFRKTKSDGTTSRVCGNGRRLP